MFPCNDGLASFTPSRAHLKRSVPETSPCHQQARQIGKLDPRRAALLCRQRSRGIETAANSSSAASNASAQLVLGSASGQPRQDSVTFETPVHGAAANPRVRGRAFSAHESRGIKSQIQTHTNALALWCLSSASSSPRRAEVGSTAVHRLPHD